MITFKYKAEKSRQGETIYRPIADVILATPKGKVEVSMYIDSGADLSIIPYSVGLLLGFERSQGTIREIKGIAGETIPYIVREANFNLGDYKFKGRVGWALIEAVPLLLGRLDVFCHFKVIFDETERSVSFIPK